jgi:release factor glutamine methyltransferase
MVKTILEKSTSKLRDGGFESPQLLAELLMAHILKIPRKDLIRVKARSLTPAELERYESLFDRLLNHEPIQYIVGTTEFMGLEFHVDPSVLIPRPETETLVERVITIAKEHFPGEVRILDIGTGSGNIAISLARFFPRAKIDAIEVSEAALTIAKENEQRLSVGGPISFLKCDILDDAQLEYLRPPYDIVVSNPPYISTAEYNDLPPVVRLHEPSTALTDANDGYTFFRRISKIAETLLTKNGWLCVETAYNQANEVARMFGECRCFTDIVITKDLSGIERVVSAKKA